MSRILYGYGLDINLGKEFKRMKKFCTQIELNKFTLIMFDYR